MPLAHYIVGLVGDRWAVRLGEKAFPYSSLDAAVAAAVAAARKAEEQGFEAKVTIESAEQDAA